MTRRIAAQSILALLGAAMSEGREQSSGSISLGRIAPQSLYINLHWEKVIVERNGETIEIDQDELFRSLQGGGKAE